MNQNFNWLLKSTTQISFVSQMPYLAIVFLTFIVFYSCDVTRPELKLTLWDRNWPFGIIIVSTNLGHLKNSHDPVKIKYKTCYSSHENAANWSVTVYIAKIQDGKHSRRIKLRWADYVIVNSVPEMLVKAISISIAICKMKMICES